MLHDCYDPANMAEAIELAHDRKIAMRPRCLCCDEPINGETCLNLKPFGINGYACEDCISSHSLDPYTFDNDSTDIY